MQQDTKVPPDTSSRIIKGYISSLNNEEEEREQAERSIAMLENAIKQVSSISNPLNPSFAVPAKPETARDRSRKRRGESLREKNSRLLKPKAPAKIPLFSRLHTVNKINDKNFLLNEKERKQVLARKAEIVKARFTSKGSFNVRPTQVAPPIPVYVPPKNAKKSVRMAELRYTKKRRKRPKPSPMGAPIKHSIIITPTISERIGMYYGSTMLSPRTLSALAKINGEKAKEKKFRCLLKAFPNVVKQDVGRLSVTKHRNILCSVYELEDVLWNDYELHYSRSIGDKVIHLPSGKLCVIKHLKPRHRRYILEHVQDNKPNIKADIANANIVQFSAKRTETLPISDDNRTMFLAICKNIKEQQDFHLKRALLMQYDEWLHQHLKKINQLPSYPFVKFEKNKEVESIGLNAIRQSHPLYLNAKHHILQDKASYSGLTNIINNNVTDSMDNMTFNETRNKIKIQHIFSVHHASELILSIFDSFPPDHLFKSRNMSELPCNARRYRSQETARRNLIIAKLDNKWRRNIIKQICSIHDLLGFDLKRFSSEEEYNKSFTKRLIRRVELQMVQVLRFHFEQWAADFVSHMYLFHKLRHPYFKVQVNVGYKKNNVTEKTQFSGASLNPFIVPTLTDLEWPFVQIAALADDIRSRITPLRGSICPLLPYEGRPLYDPLSVYSHVPMLHKKLCLLFDKTKIAVENVLVKYTYDFETMDNSYHAYDLLENRIKFTTVNSYTDQTLFINTAGAKTFLHVQIKAKRENHLEKDNLKVEKLMKSALIELKDALELIARVPSTPEEWAEQMAFRRNRHQFARRINVNVIQVVLQKISQLELFFLRFPRDVYKVLYSIQEHNVQVFNGARDMEQMLAKTGKKLSSEFRKQQGAYRKKIEILTENLLAYEENTNMELALDFVDDLEQLGDRITVMLKQRETMIFHQKQLEIEIKAKDKFLQLDHLCNEHKIFSTLWKVGGEWSTFSENWIHGEFNRVNVIEVKEKLEEWTPLIVWLLAEPLKERKTPRSVANRLRLLLHGFKKHVPNLERLRHPGMRHRHWQKIGLRPETFQEILDAKIETSLIIKVNHVADEEYKLEMEVDKMQKDYKKDPIFKFDSMQNILDMIQVTSLRVKVILQSPYSEPHELEFYEWLHELEETKHFSSIWKSIHDQWNRLKFLQTDKSFETLCTKAHAHLLKLSQTLSLQLEHISNKSMVKVATDDNINNASAMIKILNRVGLQTDLYIKEKRMAYPRLYLLSQEDTLAALRNETDVMIKLFGNGTLKYCNENEMISIHGQSILLEKCIEERKIEENQLLEQAKAKLKAMEKAKKIQEKGGKPPPIVEYEPETIPILKIIELRMKYSYQRDLRYMIKHIERDEYKNINIKTANIYMIQQALHICWTSSMENIMSLKDGSRILDKLKHHLKHISDQIDVLIPSYKSATNSTHATSNLLLLLIEVRDKIDHVIKKHIRTIDSFGWYSLVRTYLSSSDKSAAITKVGSSEIKHENEFIGGYSRAIITPLTYRCIQAMYMSSVGMLHGAILQGANQLGNYRDGIVFDMAAYLGKIYVPLYCTPLMDSNEIIRIMKGIVSLGAWALFKSPRKLSVNVTQTIATIVSHVQIAYQESVENIYVGKQEVQFCKPTFFFVTRGSGKSTLPMTQGYTPIQFSRPNFGLVSELLLVTYGFKDARILSLKLVACLVAYGLEPQVQKVVERSATLLNDALKSGSKNSIGDSKEIDEGAIISAALKSFVPSSSAFVIDYFGGSMVIDKVQSTQKKVNFIEEINRVATLLNSTVGYERSMLVSGQIHSGKTLAIKKAIGENGRVLPVYIDSYISIEDLWGGMVTSSRSTKKKHEFIWSNGIIAKVMKQLSEINDHEEAGKEDNSSKKSWIVFDGVLTPDFTDAVETLLRQKPRMFPSPVNDNFYLSKTTEIVFETVTIESCSPSFVTNCTSINIRDTTIYWPAIFTLIKPKRTDNVLKRYLDKCKLFFFNEQHEASAHYVILRTVTTMKNIMNSLQKVILSQNKVNSSSKKKIPEIVIFFASIWSFGVEALIGGFKELTEIDSFFNDMAKEMHISFPKRCGIFDIQIDLNTNLFTPWTTTQNVKTLKGLQIRRLNYISSMLLQNKVNVCVVDPGAVNVSKLEPELTNELMKIDITAFSTQNTPCSFHKKILPLLEKESSNRYRPKKLDTTLIVVIDDVNVPSKNNLKHIEHSRCYADYSGWWFPNGNWCKVDNVVFSISCPSKKINSKGNNTQCNRLLKNYALLLNEQVILESAILNTFQAKLVKLCMNAKASDEVRNLSKTIAGLSDKLHRAVNHAFEKQTSTTIFTNEVFNRIYYSFEVVDHENFTTPLNYISLWHHSVQHVYGDHLVLHRDRKLLRETIEAVIQKELPEYSASLSQSQLCYYEPILYRRNKWEEGLSFAESWKEMGIAGNDGQPGLHEQFVKEVLKISRVIRSKRLCPLVIFGDDRTALCKLVGSSSKILGFKTEIIEMRSLLRDDVKSQNNTILIVGNCSWSTMTKEAFNGGPSTISVILSKHDVLKTNARIVYIVQSSDKHACKYWRDHGMSFASMISTSQPPSSFLMKSMNNLMEDTDDRSAAIPSLTSIYRQISNVWQINFGIPCIPRQLEDCVRLVSTLITNYRKNTILVAEDYKRNEEKIINLMNNMEKNDERIKGIELDIKHFHKKIDGENHKIYKYEDRLKVTEKDTEDYAGKLDQLAQTEIVLVESTSSNLKTLFNSYKNILLSMDGDEEGRTALVKFLNKGKSKKSKKKKASKKPASPSAKILFQGLVYIFGKSVKAKDAFKKMKALIKMKTASKEGISVKLIPSSMDEQTIRLFSAFVDTAEFNELLMDENNGQIVVSCAHWIKEVNKMIQLKSNFGTKKAQLTKRMLDAITNKAKLENESSNLRAKIEVGRNNVQKFSNERDKLQEKVARSSIDTEDCNSILERMQSYRKKWADHMERHERFSKTWLGDIILTAAFVVFAGPLSLKFRKRCWKEWSKLLNSMSIESTKIVDSSLKDESDNANLKNGSDDEKLISASKASRLSVLRTFLPPLPFHPLSLQQSDVKEKIEETQQEHMIENTLIQFNSPSNTVIVIDPRHYYKQWWHKIFDAFESVSHIKPDFGKSIDDFKIIYIPTLPTVGNATWYDSTIITIDSNDHRIVTEEFIHGFATSCSQKDYLKKYHSIWEDTIIKWHNEKILEQRIRILWNNTTENLDVGDSYIVELLSALTDLNQQYGFVVETRTDDINELLPIVTYERKQFEEISNFTTIVFNILSSTRSINSFYYMDVQAFIVAVNPALIELFNNKEKSQDTEIPTVVQAIFKHLNLFIHSNDEIMLYLMIWYAQEVYFNGTEDIIANETWVYLISKIENSRKSAIKSGMRSSLLKTKHKKMDVLKSVRGNKKKLESLKEWFPEEMWQIVIELSHSLREFYHFPQSMLNNDITRLKNGQELSWKSWWIECNSIIKNEAYEHIGTQLFHLDMPLIPALKSTAITRLVIYNAFFPQATVHLLQATFENNQTFQKILKWKNSRYTLTRNKKLVDFLVNTPSFKHHTYSISCATSTNLVLNILDAALLSGVKFESSNAGKGGIKFLSSSAIGFPQNSNILRNAMSDGGWIVLMRPDMENKKWINSLQAFIRSCGRARSVHQKFKLILLFNFDAGIGSVPEDMIANTGRFLLEPIKDVYGYIIELCNAQDWSHLSLEDRIVQFTIAFCTGMMYKRSKAGSLFRSSDYEINDSHYSRILTLLNDPKIQAAISRVIGIVKKVDDEMEGKEILKAELLHMVERMCLLGSFELSENKIIRRTLDHVCSALPFFRSDFGGKDSISKYAVEDTPKLRTVIRSTSQAMSYASTLGQNWFSNAGFEGNSRDVIFFYMLRRWNAAKKSLQKCHTKQTFELEGEISANIGKGLNQFGEFLNRILSFVLKYAKLLNNVVIKSTLTVAENVVLNEEINIHRYLLTSLQKQIEFCLLKYDRGEEDESEELKSLNKIIGSIADNESGSAGNASLKINNTEEEERGKPHYDIDTMNAKLVMSSLKNNIVPTSWNSCFKAKEPMEWIKQLGKRIRYFKKWATSGTPLKHSLPMFSSPHNVFFIVKYAFARQQQLPLSAVVLVSEHLANGLYKRNSRSSQSYTKTKICVEGLYAQGIEIDKEGKILISQQTPLLVKAPAMNIYAFDRNNLKGDDFLTAKDCPIFGHLTSTNDDENADALWFNCRRERLNHVVDLYLGPFVDENKEIVFVDLNDNVGGGGNISTVGDQATTILDVVLYCSAVEE